MYNVDNCHESVDNLTRLWISSCTTGGHLCIRGADSPARWSGQKHVDSPPHVFQSQIMAVGSGIHRALHTVHMPTDSSEFSSPFYTCEG